MIFKKYFIKHLILFFDKTKCFISEGTESAYLPQFLCDSVNGEVQIWSPSMSRMVSAVFLDRNGYNHVHILIIVITC